MCICRDSKAASKQASGMSGMHDRSLFSFISRVLNFAIFAKFLKYSAKLSEDEVLVDFFLAFRGIDVLIPGGYCHIWAIRVCAAVKGMVFKQFTLG